MESLGGDSQNKTSQFLIPEAWLPGTLAKQTKQTCPGFVKLMREVKFFLNYIEGVPFELTACKCAVRPETTVRPDDVFLCMNFAMTSPTMWSGIFIGEAVSAYLPTALSFDNMLSLSYSMKWCCRLAQCCPLSLSISSWRPIGVENNSIPHRPKQQYDRRL